jgi:hypothetical protein
MMGVFAVCIPKWGLDIGTEGEIDLFRIVDRAGYDKIVLNWDRFREKGI